MKNWKLEIAMILTSFVAGSWALYHGYKKHHGYLWPLLAFCFDLSLVIIGNFMNKEWLEMTFKLFGAGAIVTAHIFNLKYNKACNIYKQKYTDVLIFTELERTSKV